MLPRMPWARPLLLLAFALPAQAEPLEFLVYPNPGIFEVSTHGEVSGTGAELMKRLTELTGVPLQLRAVPAVRAMQMAAQMPGHCMAGLPRTPEREALYRWAGLMGAGNLVLYGRADENRQVDDADDLRGVVVAAQRESQPLAWLREHGVQAYEVNDTLTGLRMLRAGHVDFCLVNDLAGQRAVQRSEGPPLKALRNLGRSEIHLACHRDLDQATADKLRRGFEQLRRNGELAEFGLR